jgi:hypothetical protein
MAEWLVVTLAVAAVGMSALCLAAVYEVFQQLEEVRRRLAMDDEPLELNIDNVDLADLAPVEVVERDRSALMFLHSTCGMCRLVADQFARSAPDGLWFVIPEHDVARLKSFEDLAALGKVIADPDEGGLADAMRLDVTPSVVLLQSGMVDRVLGVSSVSQVTRIVQDEGALGLSRGGVRVVG